MKDPTRIVHGGRKPARHAGAVNTPVYRASTMLHPSLEALETGKGQDFPYGRRATPTTQDLEEAICALEGAAGAVLVPSGLNACVTAILAAARAGDSVLVPESIYGPTRIFLDRQAPRFGIATTLYPPRITPEALSALITPETRVLYLESPGSGTFEVQDVPGLTKAAKARGLTVLADNTWASPLFFKPLAHGVDLSIQAATKYIVGHSDLNTGYVAANETALKALRQFHGDSGLTISGDDAYLTARGLRTLDVRLRQHQASALKIAEWLSTRPQVARVLYPALPSDPGHKLWTRDFIGASGLFGVELKPVSKTAVAAFFDGLKLFGMGWSWGGFESLAVLMHPKPRTGEPELKGPLVRLHIGLEHADDLIADLAAGLDRLNITS